MHYAVGAEGVVVVNAFSVADGADAISFGDTTGMATPRRVRDLVGSFRFRHPEVPLNLHFHNTRGTGLANVLAALQLVEDARYLGSDRRPQRHRARLVTERTVASRRLARDLAAG